MHSFVGHVQDSKDQNYGYDAADDVYGDMLKKGIIDPAKVTRTALENADSIATLVLRSEAAALPRIRLGSLTGGSGSPSIATRGQASGAGG